MHLNLNNLPSDLPKLEAIEKAATRMLVQALYDYREQASEIFRNETDQVADIGEDVTSEAFSKLGVSRIDKRLYGKVDLKRACYLFLPDESVRLALFIDSKAEKQGATARIQMSQLSMTVMQPRKGVDITVSGALPHIVHLDGIDYLTMTLFVKYIYSEDAVGNKALRYIKVLCLPNGMLQSKYNPDHTDTIWLVGPDSPERSEEFRTRVSFSKLAHKAAWRVQTIPLAPTPFVWSL